MNFKKLYNLIEKETQMKKSPKNNAIFQTLYVIIISSYNRENENLENTKSLHVNKNHFKQNISWKYRPNNIAIY